MELAYIILIVLAIIYVPIWVWVWRCPDKASRYHLCKYGPCIMIRTQLGMKTMDRLARYPRFWRGFGFFSKVVSAVLFLLMMYMLIVAIIAIPSRIASGTTIGIEYALAIPGFNPILPLSYGVVALVIAMVVHELGHGVQARANGARVDSSGLLYGVVPLGAFVEPNEEDMSKKSRRAQMDMYTAGISVNTVVAIVSILLLMGCFGTITSEYEDDAGVYSVDSGSPAYLAGIPASAIITGVSYAEDPDTALAVTTDVDGTLVSLGLADGHLDPSRFYHITYIYKGAEYSTYEQGKDPVQLGVYIRGITVGSPSDSSDLIKTGMFIKSIDGTPITSSGAFSDYMSGTSPGDTVTITLVSVAEYGSQPESVDVEVTLAERNGVGFLGLSVSTGGMTFTTPGIMMDAAANPFYGASDPLSYVTSFFGFLSGPFNGNDPVNDEVKWWYDTPMGDVFWMILSLLYWIFWLDILLAISNALPAYPFDGGFIFAGGVSWFAEKIGIKDEERRQRITDSIANSVSTVVLFMFILVFVSFLM